MKSAKNTKILKNFSDCRSASLNINFKKINKISSIFKMNFIKISIRKY